MSYLEILAMGAYLAAVWAASAVTAGALLWTVGLAGYGFVRTWQWFWHGPERQERPVGRKHGRRATAAEAKPFEPPSIRRHVAPPV